MNVFLTGPTGSIGLPLVRALVARGDHVTGLVRSEASAARLRALGGHAVLGDVARPDGWRAEAEAADALVRASAVPFARRNGGAWLAAARAATGAETAALLAAARAGGRDPALLYVSGWFVAGDHAESWIDESTPPTPLALGEYHRAGEAQIARAAAEGIRAFSLRPGNVYAAEGNFAKVFLAQAEKGRFPRLGEGQNFLPFVAAEDFAEACLRGLDEPPAGEAIYVVDDEPLRMRELTALLAEAFGRQPTSVPLWLAKAIAGAPLPEMLAASYRIRNTGARAKLGWSPRSPSLRGRLAGIVEEYRRAAQPPTA